MSTFTHWHYPYLYADKRGLVLTACEIRATKQELDLQDPTCKICMNAMNNHNKLVISGDSDD